MRIVTALALVLSCAGVFMGPAAAEGRAQNATVAQSATTAPVKPAINLNTATIDQLETLPGIGRKTAERIVEYRTKNGGFKRIEDLMNVKGIGEKGFLKLKPLIVAKPVEKAAGD